MIEQIFSVITQIIIFFGLYFTFFWILVFLNRNNSTSSKKINPDVSIIIPAFNEEYGVSKTIESCLNLKYEGKINIYVVNDASTDNTLKTIKFFQKYDNIKIIDKKENEGKAMALNTALKKINTPYLAVVDADSKISRTSLQKAIQKFVREDNEKVGAVISRMRPENTDGGFLERIQVIEYMMVGLLRSLSSSIRLLHLTPGVLSIYDTKLVKKLGGFDKNNLTEDFEIAVRIRKLGYLVEYCSNNLVYTKTPQKFSIFLKQRIRWSRGFIQTHKKHKETFFNKKYGLFGLYQMPMNIFGPILLFFAIFTISFNLYKIIYEIIFRMIHTPAMFTLFEMPNIYEFFLKINPTTDLLILISVLFFLIFIWLVVIFHQYNFFKQKPFKKILSLVLYIMVYNYIYIYVWIVALSRELKRKSYDWGTKK